LKKYGSIHMVSFQALLAELRQSATSTRDLGDKFERLMKAYLKTDPTYTQQFAQVYLWQEWEGRGNQSDTGIDLVAIGHNGEYCAIQCKFYDPTHSLQKSDIDSFFTASGKAPFTHRLIISTTDKWSKHAEDALNDQSLPVTRLRVQELENSPIDWTAFSITNPEKLHRRAVKEVRPHQVDALQAVSEGLSIADRGKLIMACGTGKTFTALRIAEHIAGDKPSTVLFLVPSIALLSQSLREWTAEAKLPLHCFAVCSDTKVGKLSLIHI
jgi:predicted helicase